MPAPADPKIYHIVHVDRLPSIIAEAAFCAIQRLLDASRSEPRLA